MISTLPLNGVPTWKTSISHKTRYKNLGIKTNETLSNVTIKSSLKYTIDEKNSILEIRKIAKLRDNWDGYNAKAIPKEILDNASMLLLEASKNCKIMPTAKPSLLIKYTNSISELYIELNNNDYSVFIYNQNGTFKDVGKIEYNYISPLQTVKKFYGYKNYVVL